MAHRNFLFASVHLTKWVLLWVSSVSCYDEEEEVLLPFVTDNLNAEEYVGIGAFRSA